MTLAKIRSIVGDEYVGSPILKDTHRNDAFRIESITILVAGTPAPGITRTSTVLRQFRPPESVAVSLYGQNPSAFFFRQERYEVEHAYGRGHWAESGAQPCNGSLSSGI